MEAFLNEVWDATRPALLTAITTLAPILATYLTAKLVAFLKVQKDGELAASLYRTIDNVLGSLLKAAAMRDPSVLKGVPAGLVNDAVELIRKQNPKSVEGLSQTTEMLKTKVVAKLGPAQAAVAEAAAKVEQAA